MVENAEYPMLSMITDIGCSTTNIYRLRSILKVQLKVDIVTLYSGLNESYIKLLEEGKKLALNNNTF
ncbi:MAG: hypothetical protein ACKO96_16330, partial [Flammeovirgaceae bacterium]